MPSQASQKMCAFFNKNQIFWGPVSLFYPFYGSNLISPLVNLSLANYWEARAVLRPKGWGNMPDLPVHSMASLTLPRLFDKPKGNLYYVHV
jgi:hypothetical protein